MIPIRKTAYWLLLLSLVIMLSGTQKSFAQEPGLPDLVISSITYTPQLPHPSDFIRVTVTVKNDGVSSAPISTVWLQYHDEIHPTLHNIPSLGPGETYQFQRDGKILSYGKRYITATADWNQVVEESNEDNNTTAVIVYVSKKNTYDLTVETLTHAPANPTNYDTITITTIVRNIAPLIPTTSTLEIKIGDEATPATYTVPPLTSLEAYQVQRQVKLDPGTYEVLATADINDDVDESEEANNILTDTIEVAPLYLPDLIVESLSHSPLNPFTIDTIRLTAVVRNIGNAEASTSSLSLLVDSNLTTYSIPALAPDAEFEIQLDEIYTTSGIYLVTAIADSEDVVSEFKEDNNTKEDSFFVKEPGPDLEVTSISHSPMGPTVHDIITITAIVENTGNVTATSSTAAIQAENELNPHEIDVPMLAPGETFPVEAMINFHDPGTFVVTATADALDDVEESYEDNNTAEDIIDVVLPILPDYVISGITPSEENPNTSETFTITVEVKNIGLADAGSTSVLAILAGDELLPSLHVIPALDIGTTFTIQRNLVFMENLSYLITATADVDDLIFEIYEDNNTGSLDIFIGSIFAKLKDYLLGRVDLSVAEKKIADANEDGKIDMADLLYLLIIGRT